jgi:hypothetical protein
MEEIATGIYFKLNASYGGDGGHTLYKDENEV